MMNFYSRRTFLKRLVAIGAAGLAGPGLLMACSNENTAESSKSEVPVAGKCQGSNELSASEITARQTINYVDASPYAGKACANCRFFKQPGAGTACGGCEIVAGPIAPGGYCNTWVAQS